MKTGARILRAGVVLVGIGALAFLLWEPQAEGANAHKALVEIYFQDPFVAFAYLASIPFFVALVQWFKVFGRHPDRPRALRIIKRCAGFLLAAVLVGEAWIFQSPTDDRAGGVFMGVLVAVGAAAMALAARKLERKVTSAGR